MASLAEKFERHLGLITEAALSHDRMIVCDLCVRFLHALLMYDRASSVRNQAVCILPARSFWYSLGIGVFVCCMCIECTKYTCAAGSGFAYFVIDSACRK